MWPLLLIVGAVGVYWYWAKPHTGIGPSPATPSPSPAPSSTQSTPTAVPLGNDPALVQAQKELLAQLQIDLSSGGDALQAGVTDQALANSYATVYVSGTDTQLKSMIVDARRKNYNNVADYLMNRLPFATGA